MEKANTTQHYLYDIVTDLQLYISDMVKREIKYGRYSPSAIDCCVAFKMCDSIIYCSEIIIKRPFCECSIHIGSKHTVIENTPDLERLI